MKKQVTFIAALMLAIIVAVTGQSFGADKAGEVLVVKKNVYVIRDASRNDAKPQMELQTKDAVMTDRDSRTKLFFIDDSILNLGELSKVEVEEYLYSPEKKRSKSIYKLIDGSLRVVVGRSDLEVHTETAVAAARGTKFLVWTESIGPAASTKILDNKVLLASSESQFMAGAGGDPENVKAQQRTCIMVLDGRVLLKSTAPDVEDKIMVEKGNAGCVTVDTPPEFAEPKAGKETQTFVYAPIGGDDVPELPAFAPEPGPVAGGDDFVDPGETVDQTTPTEQADITVEESEINVELRFIED